MKKKKWKFLLNRCFFTDLDYIITPASLNKYQTKAWWLICILSQLIFGTVSLMHMHLLTANTAMISHNSSLFSPSSFLIIFLCDSRYPKHIQSHYSKVSFIYAVDIARHHHYLLIIWLHFLFFSEFCKTFISNIFSFFLQSKIILFIDVRFIWMTSHLSLSTNYLEEPLDSKQQLAGTRSFFQMNCFSTVFKCTPNFLTAFKTLIVLCKNLKNRSWII